MKSTQECEALGLEVRELLRSRDCTPVDTVKIAFGYMIAFIVAHAETRDQAYDMWATMTKDARKAIAARLDATESGRRPESH